MRIQVPAPDGWIVREGEVDGDQVFAITRELVDSFPRYLVGIQLRTLNTNRRSAGEMPAAWAVSLCEMGRGRGTVVGPCKRSTSHGMIQIVASHVYPAVGPANEDGRGRVMYLADERNDELYTLIFEAPDSEWEAVRAIGEVVFDFLCVRPRPDAG